MNLLPLDCITKFLYFYFKKQSQGCVDSLKKYIISLAIGLDIFIKLLRKVYVIKMIQKLYFEVHID